MFSFRSARSSILSRSVVSLTSTPSTRVVAGRRFASQDYGSGATKSGVPNRAVDQEHPGPPPPSSAQQGKGEQQNGGGSGQQSAQSSSSKKTSSGPQPKILAENPPAEGQESEDVARHNREMSQRADKAHEKVTNEDAQKDKVPKSYWSGQGGVDKDP